MERIFTTVVAWIYLVFISIGAVCSTGFYNNLCKENIQCIYEPKRIASQCVDYELLNLGPCDIPNILVSGTCKKHCLLDTRLRCIQKYGPVQVFDRELMKYTMYPVGVCECVEWNTIMSNAKLIQNAVQEGIVDKR